MFVEKSSKNLEKLASENALKLFTNLGPLAGKI